MKSDSSKLLAYAAQVEAEAAVIRGKAEQVRKMEEQRGPTGQVRPAYYGGEADPFEPVKVIRAWGLGFNLGNVLKYIRRSGTQFKGIPAAVLQDLKKARTYLDIEIGHCHEEDRKQVADCGVAAPQPMARGDQPTPPGSCHAQDLTGTHM